MVMMNACMRLTASPDSASLYWLSIDLLGGHSVRYAIAALLVLSGLASADARTRSAFCARWHNVCKTTCPGFGASAVCLATCVDRLAACRKSGCYHFNKPG